MTTTTHDEVGAFFTSLLATPRHRLTNPTPPWTPDDATAKSPAGYDVVVRRDGDQCRFAGCTNRHYLHVHHIVHWEDGGHSDVDNLVLLCSFHRRAAAAVSRRHSVVADAARSCQQTSLDQNGRRCDEAIAQTEPPDVWA
jgi:hypothetical protein